MSACSMISSIYRFIFFKKESPFFGIGRKQSIHWGFFCLPSPHPHPSRSRAIVTPSRPPSFRSSSVITLGGAASIKRRRGQKAAEFLFRIFFSSRRNFNFFTFRMKFRQTWPTTYLPCLNQRAFARVDRSRVCFYLSHIMEIQRHDT